MWRIYGGAIMVIAGIAVFIEAHSHAPVCGGESLHGRCFEAKGLSQTAYDLLRVGAWALVVLGAVTLIVGLIRLWQRPRSAA